MLRRTSVNKGYKGNAGFDKIVIILYKYNIGRYFVCSYPFYHRHIHFQYFVMIRFPACICTNRMQLVNNFNPCIQMNNKRFGEKSMENFAEPALDKL